MVTLIKPVYLDETMNNRTAKRLIGVIGIDLVLKEIKSIYNLTDE